MGRRPDLIESYVAFDAAPALASYMSNHSTPTNRIAVFGSEPEIYFYAHRHAASGYIYMYDITSPAAHAGEMKREMLREVEAARPEFVVDVHEPFSWSVGFSPEIQRIYEWLEQYLKSGNYRRVAVAENIAGEIVYRWNSDAADHSPPPASTFASINGGSESRAAETRKLNAGRSTATQSKLSVDRF